MYVLNIPKWLAVMLFNNHITYLYDYLVYNFDKYLWVIWCKDLKNVSLKYYYHKYSN